MKPSTMFGAALGLLVGQCYALATPTKLISNLETLEPRDSQCVNGPTSRDCWMGGWTIATDFDKKFPTTGKTVTYNLELTNGTCNPDGHGSRVCFLINGQYPGPTVRASWGDHLVVNVKNSLQDNGTSIHWHGVRQYDTPGQDGVNGLTECPLAPGQSRTYEFDVTQYGTSWYHAHFTSQYGDGVVGPMIFDGPATANYDVDLGAYPLSEWYYQTAFQINSITGHNLQGLLSLPPPSADNMLINGTNKNANGGGKYSQVTMEAGKKYRLRLVNIAVDNFIEVSLDNHPFQVIAADFVPIKPFTAQWLLMGMGQRYDVVITANQTADNYYFRTQVATSCQSQNKGSGLAIWSYSNVTVGTPTSSSFPTPSSCVEPGPLTPYWYQPVPSNTALDNLQVGTSTSFNLLNPVTVWVLGNTSINVDWKDPTMSYLFTGNTSYPKELNVVPANPEAGGWNYWVMQQTSTLGFIPHPIHLHGHDFFVLGQGTSKFDASTANLNFDTPTRRDTATIYGSGWLAVAFQSNNPGVWLMHCHIAWHISEGLGLQFLERPSEIKLPDQAAYNEECAAWSSYYQNATYKKIDSGL